MKCAYTSLRERTCQALPLLKMKWGVFHAMLQPGDRDELKVLQWMDIDL